MRDQDNGQGDLSQFLCASPLPRSSSLAFVSRLLQQSIGHAVVQLIEWRAHSIRWNSARFEFRRIQIQNQPPLSKSILFWRHCQTKVQAKLKSVSRPAAH